MMIRIDDDDDDDDDDNNDDDDDNNINDDDDDNDVTLIYSYQKSLLTHWLSQSSLKSH